MNVLPPTEWPVSARLAWESACAPAADIFDEGGSAAGLRPTTLRNYQSAAGAWFAHLRGRGLLEPAAPISAHVTSAEIQLFVNKQHQAGRRDSSIWQRLMSLHAFLQLVDPRDSRCDVSHFNGLSLNVQFDRPAKPFTMQDSGQVLSRVEAHYAEADHGSPHGNRLIQLRDRALVGLLIVHAPRIGNLVSMRLGTELLAEGSGWSVRLDGSITKNGRTIEYCLAQRCATWLDAYLHGARPIFLGAEDTDRLWLTPEGRPMTVHQVSFVFRRFCQDALGLKATPHMARKWLASTAARSSPEHAASAAIALGHSYEVSVRHYRESSNLHAVRRHGEALARLRRETRHLAEP